ncbi:MAG: PAS domain S-box protein, partial [Polyangiaceae bacterium]|nr:PAS domain S-box protein [Polyangiaceae bacterium]
MVPPKPTLEELLVGHPHVAEALLSKVLRASAALIAIATRADGTCVTVNDAFLARTGWSRDEVIGASLSTLGLCLDPATPAAMLAELEREGPVKGYETALRTKSGAVLKGFCNLDAVELFGAPHVLTAFHDATEVLAARDA